MVNLLLQVSILILQILIVLLAKEILNITRHLEAGLNRLARGRSDRDLGRVRCLAP